MKHFFKPSVYLGYISQNFTHNYQRYLSTKVVLPVLEAEMVLRDCRQLTFIPINGQLAVIS